MATDDIEAMYNQLMEQSRESGDLDDSSPGSERRTAPRLRADDTELTIRAQLQVAAVDVSVGGLAFHSHFPVQIGQPLNITVGNLFTVDAIVISSTLVEADEEFTHTLYRVQCKFPEEEQGKYLLVMVKELDRRKSSSIGHALEDEEVERSRPESGAGDAGDDDSPPVGKGKAAGKSKAAGKGKAAGKSKAAGEGKS